MTTQSDRSLDGWSSIILGIRVNCTKCNWKGYYKKHEGPLGNCSKCKSKLEVTGEDNDEN